MAAIVSIVIPAYNHGRYLDEAIQSVLKQDYPNVELIVLDDGSTDDTHKVLEKYGDRFVWETQTNMGQSATLNKGWAMSKGEILGYLSADDVLEQCAVSAAVAVFEQHAEASATYCDFNLIDPRSRVIRRVTTPEFNYHDMLVTVTCPPGPGAFFRRAAFERTGPWDVSLRQMPDYDFWLRLGLQGNFVRIPEVLAGFRVHTNSQTYARTTPERAAEPVLIVQGILDRPGLPAELRAVGSEALAYANLVSAQLHMRAGRLGAAAACTRKAATLSPRVLMSRKAVRLVFNALFNRLGHQLLRWIRSLAGRAKQSSF